MFLLGRGDLHRVTHFRGVNGMRHRCLTGELQTIPVRFGHHDTRTSAHGLPLHVRQPAGSEDHQDAGRHAAPTPPLALALVRISQPLRRCHQGGWNRLVQQARVQGAQGISLLAKGGERGRSRGVVHQTRFQPDPLCGRHASVEQGMQRVVVHGLSGVMRVHVAFLRSHFNLRSAGALPVTEALATVPAGASKQLAQAAARA